MRKKGPVAVCTGQGCHQEESACSGADAGAEAVAVGKVFIDRRKGSIAKPLEESFPIGTLQYGHPDLLAIGREYGGGWDVDLMANGFRSHMGERLEKLRGVKMISSWKGFCEGWFNRRGRP